MDVRVRLPTQLRNLAAGASSVVVVVDSTPATVSSVLDSLAATHPALERRVRDETGSTRVHVNLFVDADNIRDLDGVDDGGRRRFGGVDHPRHLRRVTTMPVAQSPALGRETSSANSGIAPAAPARARKPHHEYRNRARPNGWVRRYAVPLRFRGVTEPRPVLTAPVAPVVLYALPGRYSMSSPPQRVLSIFTTTLPSAPNSTVNLVCTGRLVPSVETATECTLSVMRKSFNWAKLTFSR